MQLHLGGHLSWYDPQKRSWLDVPLAVPTALADVIAALGLPPGDIAVAAVNGQAVDMAATRVCDADRVELYPPVGGG